MGIILTCGKPKRLILSWFIRPYSLAFDVAWTYFEKYPKDPWAFKVLVSLCMAMSIGDTVGTGTFLPT